MERRIDAPDKDWLTESEAMAYLRIDAIFLWHQLVEAGFISGIRRLKRQATFYHWKGLVMAQWKMEFGELPVLPERKRKRKRKRETGQDSHETE